MMLTFILTVFICVGLISICFIIELIKYNRGNKELTPEERKDRVLSSMCIP